MPKTALKIKYSKQFEKDYLRAPQKIQVAFRKRRELFIADFDHSLLHNHALSGKYKGWYSINITGDWRALYIKDQQRQSVVEIITFMAIGTHSQLYR